MTQSNETSAATSGRWRRVLRRTVPFLILVALCGGSELYLRTLHAPSVGLTRFIFLQEMSRERWDYLEEHRDELLLDDVRKEKAGVRHPNQVLVEVPEMDRPPWDRVTRAYEVRTNGHGFRDAAFQPAKPEGRRRILILGDSLVYGKGLPVEKRFSDMLRTRAPANVEVLNLGDLGCGVECQLQILQELIGFQPDLVIVQPSGNDLDQSMWRMAMRSEPGWIARRLRGLMHSRVVQGLAYALYGDTQMAQVAAALKEAAAFYAKTLQQLFGLGRTHGFKLLVASFPAANGVWYGGHVTDACEAARDVCLGVVALDVETPERWLPGFRSDPEVAAPESRPWLKETAEIMDLPVSSLVRIFPLLPFFADLVHPSALTHRLVTEQLDAFLKERWPPWVAVRQPPVAPAGPGATRP